MSSSDSWAQRKNLSTASVHIQTKNFAINLKLLLTYYEPTRYIKYTTFEPNSVLNTDEVGQIEKAKCGDVINGLPPIKIHCPVLAKKTIHATSWNYSRENDNIIYGVKAPKICCEK